MELIDWVREKLGFEAFVKIDPNTQDADTPEISQRQRLGQATIVAVLAGLYKYSRSEEGFYHLLNKDKNLSWGQILFGNEETRVVQNIVEYAGTDAHPVRELINDAGMAAWEAAEHRLEDNFNYKPFSNLFNDLRNDILHYLPASLQIGKVLNDNSLDDRTNKMEGPASGMMHRIEKIFSMPQ